MDRLSTKGSMIDQIDLSGVPRSAFDRSFHNFLSCKLGKIVPTRIEEVLPGDRIKGNTHIVANFEPLVAPILANMVLKQETFYVPQSILWKSAHNFFTGKKGFEGTIPSVSMQDIIGGLDVVASGDDSIPFLNYGALFGTFKDNGYTHFSDDSEPDDWADDIVRNFILWRNAQVTNLSNFGDHFYVRDLVQPLIDILNNLKYHYDPEHSDISYIGNSSFTILEQKDYIVDFLTKYFGFMVGNSSLLDYMGLGISNLKEHISDYLNYSLGSSEFWQVFSEIPLNWLPFRAAYCVWYWNYRDQLLETNALDAEEFIDNDQLLFGEIPLLLLLRVRCWFKDTFTTALTNTGNGNVLIPAFASGAQNSVYTEEYRQILDNTTDDNTAHMSGSDVFGITIGNISYNIPSTYLIHNTPQGGDIDHDYYISLDMIDRAKRLTTWLQKRLVLGVEYDDVLYSSFMVKLSNVRMRVPELLDAGRSTVALNTVINNTTIPEAQVAGDKSAVAWVENSADGVNYYAEEHGYLISFMSVMPIQSYTGGLQRLYLRQNRFDFAWPEFAQLGFDAIYNAELVTPNEVTNDDGAIAVFGYQGRYYDYKSKLDEEHGRMKGDLNYMTFGREFSLKQGAPNKPVLNYIFAHCWPATDMFVVDNNDEDIVKAVDISHNYTWERVLPVPSEVIR